MLSLISFVFLWVVVGLVLKLAMSLSVSFLVGILVLLLILGQSHLVTPFYSAMMMSVESLGLVLAVLSVWVSLTMFLVSMQNQSYNVFPSGFVATVMILLMVVVVFFVTSHLMMFYFMFEVSLIPTAVLVLKWGYQPERLQAGFYFMMYTISASLPLLFVLLISYLDVKHFSLLFLYPFPKVSALGSFVMFQLALILAFLVKVPMWGVHLWLPKAHVEAPVSGSMILAGVLLKLGGFGLMKVLFMLPFGASFIYFIVMSICLWSVVVVSLFCFRQTDIKGLIAYSSIVHMAFMVLGLLSGSLVGILGASMMMVAHGFSSPGLFVWANYNYQLSMTRNLFFHKGLFGLRPLSAFFWFLLLAANMSAPPSLNLVSEVLIYASLLSKGLVLGVILGTATLLAAGYNLYLYSVQQGPPLMMLNPGSCLKSVEFLVGVFFVLPVYFFVLFLSPFVF